MARPSVPLLMSCGAENCAGSHASPSLATYFGCQSTSAVWAALLGAGVAGGIAVLTQLIAGRQNRSVSWDDERAARVAAFLTTTHAAVLAIVELAYLPMDRNDASKAAFRSGPERVPFAGSAPCQNLLTDPYLKHVASNPTSTWM